MKRAIAGRAAWRDPRIALGKARQAAKAPVLALGRQIDAFAAGVEAQLRVGESHYHGMIEAEEERRVREREEQARAEQARIDGLRARVAAFGAIAQRAVGMPPQEIDEQIAKLERAEISGFEEYAGMAYEAKDSALRALRELHANAVQRQEQAARLAQLEAENLERQRREAAEREQREQRAGHGQRNRKQRSTLDQQPMRYCWKKVLALKWSRPTTGSRRQRRNSAIHSEPKG